MDYGQLNLEAEQAAQQLQNLLGLTNQRRVKGAIVLGTGWGDKITPLASVAFGEASGLFNALDGIHGHARRFGVAMVGGKRVLVISGRIHMYEGRPDLIYLLMRIVWSMGVRKIIMTNAVGGLRDVVVKGDIIVARSVIKNCESPLKGAKFQDPNRLIKPDIVRKIWFTCPVRGVHTGDVVVSPGPEFESPADRRFIDRPGVLAVGMSPYADLSCLSYFADQIRIRTMMTSTSVVVISCCSNGIEDPHGHEGNVSVMHANAGRLARMLAHTARVMFA